ncbi:hypothetical protein N24_3162 [Corynebacterium suranareeae]|uniref:Uncharacterized protein n=1 Tax=Corynebacterium suranareeae TaxID=2506452 RepID=A0A169SCL9_9CORY|nr:hypothetical protein N24_3162 [Corynebacterium suranareeae]
MRDKTRYKLRHVNNATLKCGSPAFLQGLRAINEQFLSAVVQSSRVVKLRLPCKVIQHLNNHF